ncbi:MAG: GNAT family N-acetyltransferase [Candidatus Obscuribacterales bacterium]|nr:GNAT family N-acetyltransferase [Steroidobacteraceae bacterium]
MNTYRNSYRIRLANCSDPMILPGIERQAASVYRDFMEVTGLTEQTITDTQSVESFAAAQQEGLLWVVVDRADTPVGFALLRRLGGTIHLNEFDVHPSHARRGLGAALLRHVIDVARSQGVAAVTLTTYRDVSWNAPFYKRMGFRILKEAEWTPALRELRENEVNMGLRIEARVVMRYELSEASRGVKI